MAVESRLDRFGRTPVKMFRWVCGYTDCLTAGARSSGPWGYSESAALAALRTHTNQQHRL